MARLAATDGVITPTERKLLSEFANTFDLDSGKVIRLAYAFAKGVELPEVDLVNPSEMKGRLFEQFVVSLLGPNCRLLAWRSDKIVGNTYAAENLLPDLQIRHKFGRTKVEYFVECKYRSRWDDKDCVDLGDQYKRYRHHAKSQGLELFIALGVGGMPSAPEELFVIPARMIGYNHRVYRKRVLQCLCSPSPAAFHHYMSCHLPPPEEVTPAAPPPKK